MENLAKNSRKYSKKSNRNTEWALSGKTNKHHNFAKSRGGTYAPGNIFVWDIMAHKAFHFLFGNRTLLEASDWLRAIDEQKNDGISLDIMDR